MRHRATLGLPNAAGIKARSEMNKASSRGKNNSEGMKRSRRNQGGAQSAALSLAKAQLWESVPVPGVCCCVPSAMGQRNPWGHKPPVHPMSCGVLCCPAGATASPEGDFWRWESFAGLCMRHQQPLGCRHRKQNPHLCQHQILVISLFFQNRVSPLETFNSLGKDGSALKVTVQQDTSPFHSLSALIGNQG